MNSELFKASENNSIDATTLWFAVGFYKEPTNDRNKKVKAFFNGRYRYSTKFDHSMVDYPDYICKSIHQGGFLLPETSLFRPSTKSGGNKKQKKTLLPAEIRKEYPGLNYIEDIMALHQGH